MDTNSKILNPNCSWKGPQHGQKENMYTIHTHTHHGQKVNILNFKCIRFPKACRLQDKFTSPTDINLLIIITSFFYIQSKSGNRLLCCISLSG